MVEESHCGEELRFFQWYVFFPLMHDEESSKLQKKAGMYIPGEPNNLKKERGLNRLFFGMTLIRVGVNPTERSLKQTLLKPIELETSGEAMKNNWRKRSADLSFFVLTNLLRSDPKCQTNHVQR